MENKITQADSQLTETANEQTDQHNHSFSKQEDLNLHIEQLKLEQNLLGGFAGGFVASLIGAIIWAVITVITNYQIGYMAVAVGFLVGYSVRYFGKGINQVFGIMGAVLSLFGCLFGNFLCVIGYASDTAGLTYIDLLFSFNYQSIMQVMIATFSPMDLLFYGFAMYEGYKFSFIPTTDQEE
jgi:hypothetical protein